jgi:hypothetical protein
MPKPTDAERQARKAQRQADWLAKPLQKVKRGDANALRKALHNYMVKVDEAGGDYATADAAQAPKPQQANTL